MYNILHLKDKVEITETQIECPVIGCENVVRRIRRGQKLKHTDFLCPKHNIYISPSTFEYVDEFSNILVNDEVEIELYKKIKSVKRESRISREKSEDAVSWNVFQYLNHKNYLKPFFIETLGIDLINPELVFWSFSEAKKTNTNGTLNELAAARYYFGEVGNRTTEPDIIVKAENAIVFIEAKLVSGNSTSGNEEKKKFRIDNPKKYDGEWFPQIFRQSYQCLINSGYYELMRLWLLGTWISKKEEKKFYLLNLTREKFENNIEQDFKPLIKETSSRYFSRVTWEAIYKFIKTQNNDKDREILEYFENKSCGFDSSGKKQRMFNIKSAPNRQQA